MALSPSIPTSFVPKQPVSNDRRRFSSSGNNILLFIAIVILCVTMGVAVGVFLYSQYLAKEEVSKAQQILTAQKNVSEAAVNQFIRLHDRFDAATLILDQHIALTQFFNLLETITVQDVYFSDINIQVNDDRSASITMSGEAKDFNALAAQSNVFASQTAIKNAVFSNFGVNQDGSVSFSVAADIDPSLIIEAVPLSEQAVPVIGPVPAPAASTTTLSQAAAAVAPVITTNTAPVSGTSSTTSP